MILGSHAQPARDLGAGGKPNMPELSLLKLATVCPPGLFPRPAFATCAIQPLLPGVWGGRKRRKR
jgi:hypothetical protein